MACHLKLIFIVIVGLIGQTTGENVNIALNKPANQSSSNRGAGQAVNGNPSDSSLTQGGSASQWWRVDLQDQYYIRAIKLISSLPNANRLKQVYILTSSEESPSGDPHPKGTNWTISYYVPDRVDGEKTITLYPSSRIRHIAWFIQTTQQVGLNELEVYSYEFGEDTRTHVEFETPVRVSSRAHHYFASFKAIDNNTDMFDSGSYFSSRSYTTATVGHFYIIPAACNPCVIKLYPYLRSSRDITEDDFTRLSTFSILTTENQATYIFALPSPDPNLDDWSVCTSQTEEQKGPVQFSCGNASTSIKYVAVYKTSFESLEIAEIQVFNPEPRFDNPASVTVTGKNTTCVQVSWPSAVNGSYYRINCGSSWSDKMTTTTSTECGFPVTFPVTCGVVAVDDGGVSSTIDGSGSTLPNTQASFRSGDVTLVAVDSTTLNLSWIEPPSNSEIIEYRFRCKMGSGSYSNVTDLLADARTISIGPYGPYQPITCRVRVQNRAGAGDWTDVGPVRTTCAAPSSPTLNDVTQTARGSGSDARVDLTMSWQSSTANCASVTYNVQLTNTRIDYLVTNQQRFQDHQLTLTVNPYQPFLLSVRAVNNYDMRSNIATKSFWSQEAAPVFGNAVATLMAVSWSSLSLSWSSPQYEFGNITGYKHRCKSQSSNYENWNTRTSPPSWSVTVGGFDPYDYVTCQIEVSNSVGTDRIERSNRTLCNTPYSPTLNDVTQTARGSGSGARVELNVSWQPSTANCASVTYTVELRNTGTDSLVRNKQGYPDHQLTWIVNPNQPFLLSVTAVNNVDMRSSVATKNFWSQEAAPVFGDAVVTLMAVSWSSLSLSWSPPRYGFGSITGYKHRCKSQRSDWNTWTSSPSRSVTVGGFNPYDLVTCQIEVSNSAGTDQIELSGRTLCDTPSSPPLNDVTQTSRGSGSDARVELSMSWQPSTANCGSVTYTVELKNTRNGSRVTNQQGSQDRQLTVTVSPNQPFQLSVTAVNNDELRSSLATKNFWSQEAPPVFGDAVVTLMAVSWSSLSLTWSSPQYEFGSITGYKHRCKAQSSSYANWNTRMSSPSPSVTVNGFHPYDLVTCQIQVTNSAGTDETERSSRTLCDNPTRPTFSLSEDAYGGHRRISVTEIQAEANCANLSVITLKLYEQGISEPVRIREYPNFINRELWALKAVTNYSISINVTNNEDMTSPITTKSITTEELPPYFGSASVEASAISPYAVRLAWQKPLYDNGILLNYTYRCNEISEAVVRPDVLTATVDGFPPRTAVTCTVKVVNSAGEDQKTSSSIHTYCAEPSDVKFTLHKARYIVNGSTRWQIAVNISSASEHNCDSIDRYEVVLKRDVAILQSENITGSHSDLQTHFSNLSNLNTTYTISAVAVNNQGNGSLPSEQQYSVGEIVIQPVRQLRIQANGPYCVELSWLALSDQPNTLISNYNYQCNDLDLGRTTGLAAEQCGFAPYQQVSCWVQTIITQTEGTITYSDAIHTDCADPGPTSFNLEEQETVGGDISIAVQNIQVLLNCKSLTKLIIRIFDGDKIQREHVQDSTADRIINGLRPFTSYRVEIEVINNALKISDTSSQHIVTRETAPSDGPRNLQVFSNSTCIILSWLPPARPNGDIKLYQGNCSYDENTWLVISDEPHFITCSFPPPKFSISCSLKAENLAGESPIVHFVKISKTEDRGSPTASSIGESVFLYGLFGLIPVTIIIAVVAVCLRRRRRREDNEHGVTESTARHTYEGLNLSSLNGTRESSTDHIYDQPFSNRKSVANDIYELPDVGQDSHARQENDSQQRNESQQSVDFYENMTSDLSDR